MKTLISRFPLYYDVSLRIEGNWSNVYSGKKLFPGEFSNPVILKVIKYSKENKIAAEREAKFLKLLANENSVIKLIDFFKVRRKEIYLVMEEVTLGDLSCVRSLCTMFPKLRGFGAKICPPSFVLYVLPFILAALQHLHKYKIIHRDIKENNLLLTANGIVKLCDFGFATTFQEGLEGLQNAALGTNFTCAPEVALRQPVTAKADIFSTGITCLTMLFGVHHRFDQCPPYNIYWNIRDGSSIYTKSLYHFYKDEFPLEPEKQQQMFYSWMGVDDPACESVNTSGGDPSETKAWNSLRNLIMKMTKIEVEKRSSLFELCEEPVLKGQVNVWLAIFKRSMGWLSASYNSAFHMNMIIFAFAENVKLATEDVEVFSKQRTQCKTIILDVLDQQKHLGKYSIKDLRR